jgi:hypothetical protein
MEVTLRMTHLAPIRERLGAELCPVRIGVAALAGGGREFVFCVLTSRLVARLTLGGLVFSLQAERALLVHFEREQGRFEPLIVVAGGTVAAACSFRKLSLMDVLMTVGA